MDYVDIDAVLAEDIIDSRDLVAIRDSEDGEDTFRDDVRRFLAEIEDYAEDDAEDGVTIIADRYFVDYARELADDIGAIDPDAGWPTCCIDWEQAADMLKQDYSEVRFGGLSWWVR